MNYRITMATGEPVLCMPQELARLLLALRHGQPCVLRQGIINPEHFIAITEEKKIKGTLPDIFHGVPLRAERGGEPQNQIGQRDEMVPDEESRPIDVPPRTPKRKEKYDPWRRIAASPPVDNLLP